MDDYLVAYTDGSSKNDKGKVSNAGVAFYIPSMDILRSRPIKGTNSIAELVAIDYCLWYCNEKLKVRKVHIFSDSNYAINVLSNGYKYKVNVGIIDHVKEKIKLFDDVKFSHVDGHSGIEENEKVDKAAKEAAKRQS